MRYSDAGETQYNTTATELASSSAEIAAINSTVPEMPGNKTRTSGNRHSSQAITVLIVDDHTLIREGLRQLFALENDIEVIGDAANASEALSKIRRLHPDVVLMDIHMPLQDGIWATKQITQEFPNSAVIMLTMHCQHQQVIEAMKNGARGYLLKSASVHDIARAIRAAYTGEIIVAPEMMGAIVNEVRRGSNRAGASIEEAGHATISALTEKELEIIRYLATGMSNKEIAETLAYSEKTVKNYLSIIYQKLHLRDRTQVAIFALRHGLLPDDREED